MTRELIARLSKIKHTFVSTHDKFAFAIEIAYFHLLEIITLNKLQQCDANTFRNLNSCRECAQNEFSPLSTLNRTINNNRLMQSYFNANTQCDHSTQQKNANFELASENGN